MPVTIKSTGGGSVTVQAPNTASDYTVNFPAANGDMVVAVSGSVPVSQGGTGATTLTANNVVLGNGTSAVQFVAPGSSGNVLTSNGTTWASTAPAASGFSSAQYFTASGTFTVPTGITKVKVTVVGGGGGGGPADRGAGGGAGGVAIKYVTGLTPGGTVSVTVGAAGTAGSGGGAGGSGGTSSFGAYCSATGGAGGPTQGVGGAGGSGSSGDLNLQGGFGGTSLYNPSSGGGVAGGAGGTNMFGGGGTSSLYANAAYGGSAGRTNTGAGGGGSGEAGVNSGNGYAGGSGLVIVEY